MTDAPAIRVEGVEFAYVEGSPVLRGIDLTVGRGEFVTVIGQNGSGKSTLIKHFNGLLRPDGGVVHVHDPAGESYDTRRHSIRSLSRLVGHVFQNPDDQLFYTSINDDLWYGLENLDVPREEGDARIDRVLEQVELDGRRYANQFQLGKGERQRLALAGVLVMEPPILCVDEPTTGQDPAEARRLMDILREYNERGNTVVVVTHDMALAATYTDRLIALKDGDVLADGPPAEVFRRRAALAETNIRPPQITRLWDGLRERLPAEAVERVWLTVDDAHQALRP